jgi:O-antigen/teichoic acid export membrane protein
MAGAAINVALNLVLIPRYGAVAAAITTAVSQVVVAMMNYYFSRDLWKPRLQGPLALSVGATCLMMAGLLIVRGDFPVVIVVLFGALLYGGAYALGIGVWSRMRSRANPMSA